MFCEEITIEEGSPCPECATPVVSAPSKNCSCHISPPCSSCVDAGYKCPDCGWDNSPILRDEDGPNDWVLYVKHEPGSRRDCTTRTHVANDFNSTPFSDCCGVASFGPRCDRCQATITGHDDGLRAIRAKTPTGHCLMCGKKRGPIHIAGNCNC